MPQDKSLSPEDVMTALQQGATTRTRNSLDIIYAVCQEQAANGSTDFSIATIGRLSASRGGPAAPAIRNATGEHYRTLIQAWTDHTNGMVRKQFVRPEPGVADDVLDMIPDAAVRALVGSFLAQNRQLLAENTSLKKLVNTQLIIDHRPVSVLPPHHSEAQTVHPLSILLPAEVEALQHSISEELFKKMGWMVDRETGRIRVKADNSAISKPGYVTAIQKVLNALPLDEESPEYDEAA